MSDTPQQLEMAEGGHADTIRHSGRAIVRTERGENFHLDLLGKEFKSTKSKLHKYVAETEDLFSREKIDKIELMKRENEIVKRFKRIEEIAERHGDLDTEEIRQEVESLRYKTIASSTANSTRSVRSRRSGLSKLSKASKKSTIDDLNKEFEGKSKTLNYKRELERLEAEEKKRDLLNMIEQERLAEELREKKIET